MQQRYRPTPANLVHITLDLKYNKAFMKQKSSLYLGLACVAEKLVPSESSNRHQHLWRMALL
jgi:hypothetical protein